MIRERADTTSVRKSNQGLILQTVFNTGVLSRAEISKLLSMSKPAVNEHIDILLGTGIIKEMGIGTAAKSGGRRPILIEPNPEYRINIALDLNYAKPLVALGTFTGNPIDKISLETLEDFDSDEEDRFENIKILIKESIDRLLIKNKVKMDNIGVAVISTPGIINLQEGKIHINPQFKSRFSLQLKRFIEECYSVNVLVENDVNMAAVAEAKFLKNEGISDLMFISCGLGVGAAMILDGKLYEGSKKAAGEIGYFIDAEDSTPLDEKLSIRTLLRNLKDGVRRGEKTVLSDSEELRFDTVIEAYTKKDAYVISEIRRISRLLGVAANNALALYDVGTIVIGGDYIVFKDILLKEIEKVITESPVPNKPVILPTSLGYAGGIIGCFIVATNYMIEHLEI